MRDNEIIKALECCSCETIMYCEDQCPFYKKCTKDEQLSKYALDLINRQKAENSNLQEKNSNLTSDLTSLRNDLTSAKAEIERLRKKCENTQIGYNFAQDDIKTLKKDKYKLQKALNQLEDYRVIAKAEAYKEFAEEIFELFPTDKSVTYITRVTVKHILKELMGDNK